MANKKKSVLKLCHELHKNYSKDFQGWVERFISFEGLKHKGLTWQQVQIAQTLIDDKRVACAAGGGIGKSAVAALLILWFLSCHPHSKIPTTAPSGKQLRDILWSEIDFWMNRCSLKHLFVRRKDLLHIHSFKEWYAAARTVPKDGKDLNDTLAGFHAPYLLIVVDESSGVPNPVFTALDGAMTQENSFIFLISNPVSTGGYFYDTITEPEGKGKDFSVLFYSSKDSPLVDESYEQAIINRYGEDSPMYKAKVLGMPISMLDTAVVLPEDFDRVVQQNRHVYDGDIVLGVDVGGQGKDLSVICHKQGWSIIEWTEFPVNDTDYLVEQVKNIALNKYKGRKVTVIVDSLGEGAGVYSNLEKVKGFKTLPFVGSESAFHKEMFKNKRSEGFYRLSKNFEDIHFPKAPPERLKKELVNLRFDFDKGPIDMEPKKKFKTRTGISPDYADALMYACSIEVISNQKPASKMPINSPNVFKKLMVPAGKQKYGKYSKFVV